MPEIRAPVPHRESRETPAGSTPTIRDLDVRITRALADRGIVMGDLLSNADSAEVARRWAAQRRAGNLSTTEEAAEALRTSIASLVITAVIVERKLIEVETVIDHAGSDLAPDAQRTFRERVTALRARATAPADDRERSLIVREIAALQREIIAARPAH